MSSEMTQLLRDWEFDPEANIRRVTDGDGVQLIQVRVDQGAFQGILQVRLDGRPDGRRPHGLAFALDHFRARRDRFAAEHGSDQGYALSPKECGELFDESTRIYGRYVFLLQLKDYQRVVRDTERNMDLFRFVRRYAEREEDRLNLEKWWPYILRINAVAKAMMAADADDFGEALAIVAQAQEQIAALDPVEAEEFTVELERSQQALSELVAELETRKPRSRREILEKLLAQAVEREAFERAAQLRDELKKLTAEASPEAAPGTCED